MIDEIPTDAEECIDYDPDTCRGEVEPWNPGYGHRSFMRCRHHGEERIRRYEESELERCAHSDVAPSWFDPTIAGERWDDDY